MTQPPSRRNSADRSIAIAFAFLFASLSAASAAEPVRTNAVVSLTFEEAGGNAGVAVAGAPQPYSVPLVNGPSRVASPFWNQTGKSALRLDANKKQSVALADIPYLDRPDAVTLSFFFLSLHPAIDGNSHGIVGKRSPGGRGTNYGINYVPSADVFQLYVNDGRGFRIANYSARQVLGVRKLVHLTATLEVGDAPAPDADTNRDDVLARLFVNGEPAVPKSATGGDVNVTDVWFTNVNVAGLLNDAPLTLGSSTPDIEHTSGVIDEFLLFARALSPAEAQRLFLEMAGPDAAQLARREQEIKTVVPPPAIGSISQFGLQVGQTTRLSIRGSRLAGTPRIDLPIAGLKQAVVKGSTAGHLMVDVTLPANVPPGIYPLTVLTVAGMSKPVGIAVDGLPQLLIGDSAPDRPAAVPAAFSGLLSGPGQGRVYFNGKAGARIVAEVEAKRIGSKLEPVLELKNLAGSALAIEWGKSYLRGDARAEVRLPADGVYIVELHDLAYNAPGDSPFRVLVGDFRAVDQYFPAVAARGSVLNVEPVGTGIPPGMMIAANLKGDPIGLARLLIAPPDLHVSGPLPPLRLSDGLEILQVAQPVSQLQTIDARFSDKQHAFLAVNGRLAQAHEVNRYLLAVTPGQTLSLSVEGRSLNSPVEGAISILSHPDGKVLATDGGKPGAAANGFQYQVPANVSNVEVAVHDLLNRGGRHFVYRLKIAPAGQPSFDLTLLDTQLNVPQQGRAVAELRVERADYNGPIELKLAGDEHISISPKQLPAEGASRKVLVTFAATGDKALPMVQRLRLVGESVGLNPPIHRVAVLEGRNEAELAGFLDQIPVATRGASPAHLEIGAIPSFVLKGVDTDWPIVAAESTNKRGEWLRLSLVSTEAARPNESKKRRGQKKPLIAAAADQAISTAAGKGQLHVTVPIDVAEPAIDFAIKADVVPHPYSNRVIATTYSAPFRMLVQDAVSLTVDKGSLNLAAGTSGKVRGKITRHPAFKGNVNVAIAGLPAGYAAKPVTLAADKADFEIAVTAPKEPAARALPNVTVTVSLSDGKVPINQPIELKVAPASAATKK